MNCAERRVDGDREGSDDGRATGRLLTSLPQQQMAAEGRAAHQARRGLVEKDLADSGLV